MKSLTAEITAHLNRMYGDFILTDSNRFESYRMSHTVWLADLPSTVDGKSICENLRILSGVTSILQLAKVKLSSE